VEPRPRYIAVEGPPGVGRTSLARVLGERLGARPALAPPNPFLDGLYDHAHGHAFAAQLYRLLSRYQQQGELGQEDLFARGGVVSDYLFACDRILAQVSLGPGELALYDKVHGLLGARSLRPDLVVYLQARAEVLQTRLRRRGDARVAPRDYLEKVVQAYSEFFFHYGDGPLLVVNTSEIDFVERRSDQDELVAVIQRTRSGVSHFSPLGSR
jgi:deoxyadenosine/deoxycytidine kinase